MTAIDTELSLPAAGVKRHRCRRLFFAAALIAAIDLHGQAVAGSENSWLDENQVRQAMRQEAFRLLAEKIDSVETGAAAGFDYHIEQAYAKIKNRLPSGRLSAGELEAWLRQFPRDRKASGDEGDFQTLIENFINGMSLEVINTLQFECDQAEDLIAQVARLARELKKTAHPDREALDRALRQSGLSRKVSAIVKDIDRHWRTAAADADDFIAFSALKKNMTGHSADEDQRLVFKLGDRYRSRFPFLDGFMGNYRRLAGAFRRTVIDLNAMLDGSANPDPEPLDENKLD